MSALASVISVKPTRDTRLVRVQCPFCRRIHFHGYGWGTQELVQHRVADCGGGDYSILIPPSAAELVQPGRAAARGAR